MNKTKKINKFLYGYKIYVNYGQGWEFETFEETLESLKVNLKAYRENCTYPIKWTISKIENPSYKNIKGE